jgi:N-acetylglucosaminyldiphosphoundecaprenol N-acetyl-beta-D-mannosaminyltransferase
MANNHREPRANILGVGVSVTDLGQALERVESFIGDGGGHYVCVCNVDAVVTGMRDPGFRRIQNRADLVLPDGMPIAWGSRLLGFRQQRQVRGPDLVLALCQRSVERGYSHFFYGGRDGVPQRLARKLASRFPGLRVAGCYSPPFRPLTPEEDQRVVGMINASGADILWVGLGAPKQEHWMASHRGRVQASVMIGVGAAFDFHSGTVKEAPGWVQRSGLEWLFRLSREPGRLWQRYLLGNTAFVVEFALQLLGLSRFSGEEGRRSAALERGKSS